MVQQNEQRRPIGATGGWAGPPSIRRLGLALLTVAMTLVSGVPAASQEAACAMPAAPAAVATPTAPTPTTEPIIIAPARRGVSTPVAEVVPAATPMPTPDPVATLSTELTDVAHALAACLTAGDAELVSTLATERYLGQLYGSNVPLSRDDYLALAAQLDPVPTEIRAVTDVAIADEDHATTEVTSVVGRQLLVSRWTFERAPASARAEGESRWQVDHEEALPFAPPAGAAQIRVTIADYSFTLENASVTGPDVVLSGGNSGTQDHEMLVLRLDEGATTQDLLRGVGPGLPDTVTYVGQATVPVAERVDLVLVDLAPGTYTVVCFFLTPEGIPHLALGMEGTFTVEE